MSEKIIKVIFFFIAIGVVVYVVQSGIVGSGLNALKSAAPHGVTTTSIAQNPGTIGGANNNGNATNGNSNNGNSNGGTVTTGGGNAAVPINPADIPQGFTASQLSPNFHAVRFGGVSYGGYNFYGQITLNAYNLSASTSVDITGWQIKAKHGGEFIPQAINVYDPSGLTAPTDIIMRNGDTVTLYSSPGPFNLRINKCIGYIGVNNKTVPQLPQNCPYPDRSAVQNFTGACQNYVTSIGGCTQPNLADPRIPFNDYACRNYLANNFTYRACFDTHVADADFLANQVWVWTGNNVIDQYHDQVQLQDRNGLLVDVYSY
jgi:hypothetical protein